VQWAIAVGAPFVWGVGQVTRSERIRGTQALSSMRAELRELAVRKREEKGASAHGPVTDEGDVDEGGDDDEELSPWTPEERVRMYREMAEQKEEQERSKAHLQPKKRCASPPCRLARGVGRLKRSRHGDSCLPPRLADVFRGSGSEDGSRAGGRGSAVAPR
jgi:hypothetical protein